MNHAPAMPMATAPARATRSMQILFWLRRTHGWFGLWGAVLGLLFGIAGIWLNHRAIMKLPMAQERVNAQVTLLGAAPNTPSELAKWLQAELRQDREPNSVRIEPARKLAWTHRDGSAAMQPEHWIFTFGGPDAIVQADYWRGNGTVNVVTTHNGLAATLANLHKGVGMSAPWILLVDTLAGCIIFLSLSGVAIWLMTNRRRPRTGLAILGTSVLATCTLVAWRLLG
ncbi:PepSY-associated TM helix domain-containing protein [Ramlibacter monticola]